LSFHGSSNFNGDPSTLGTKFSLMPFPSEMEHLQKSYKDKWFLMCAQHAQMLRENRTRRGMGDTGARANRVLALETQIATAQRNGADRCEEDKICIPMKTADLEAMAPDLPWDAFLAETRVPLMSRNGERYVRQSSGSFSFWRASLRGTVRGPNLRKDRK
jgi:predicted metalloendopeptidase